MIQLPNQSVRAPIWVLDPKTGQEVDVAPFLEMLDAFDTIYDDEPTKIGAGGVMAVQALIRKLNLIEFNPINETPLNRVDTYADLHRLEDMFDLTRRRQVTTTY